MSNYPRDEFDQVPENSSRHGVHRTTLSAPKHRLLPWLYFVGLLVVVGLLAFFVVPPLVSGGGNTPVSDLPVASSTSTSSAKATVKATPKPTATPAPKPKATPTPTTPASVVDKSVSVDVFNDTGISGLAAKYAGTLTNDGWTVGTAANWAGAPQSASVIFYDGAAQLANAQSLGASLGIPTLENTAEIGVPLAVVLGPGAQ